MDAMMIHFRTQHGSVLDAGLARVILPGVMLMALVASPVLAQSQDVTERVRALFTSKCADCHGAELKKPKGGLGNIEHVQALLANAKYVKRFDPANSLLYQYLDGSQTPQMPKGDDPLTLDELKLVRE